jgi:hypothetical protein
MKMPAMGLSLVVVLVLSPWSGRARAADECRTGCPPRDDQAFLQALVDACPEDAACLVPEGAFSLSAPLKVRKSLHLQGAGGGPRKAPRKRVTEIRVPEASRIPVFTIEGDTPAIDVSIRDAVLTGGGIHVGGPKDPCRGIDAPVSSGVHLTLLDLTIATSALDAIRFEGTSLTVSNVDVSGNVEGAGLYVASATGDVVIIDAAFVGHARWGIYVCNLAGTGQVFMNDVSVSQNGRGGIAIVGRGTPPGLRTVCVQNTGAAFNNRFGILLVDVAKTLLFNVAAGFTFSVPDGPIERFGHGLAVSGSADVFLWNVTASLNEQGGLLAVGPGPGAPSHLHLVGDIATLNNTNNAIVEGHAEFHAHTAPTSISGLCGFSTPIVAPPADLYCEQNLVQVSCSAVAVGVGPPDPLP